MYKTFKHNGKVGDVIFSLPTIRQMGGGILYLPETTAECPTFYRNMKALLEQQPYIQEVREYPSNLPYLALAPEIKIDVDLDRHRNHALRGMTNMVKRYYEVFGITADWQSPWLTVEGTRHINHDYNLINLTPRFRDNSRVNWKRVFEHIPKPVYFIGTESEHEYFVQNFSEVERLCTTDLITFALYIKYCSALYCNQSAALSIAQGLGKTYFLEKKPNKNNCLFYTENENILL